MKPYWSIGSLILFICLALFGMLCMNNIKAVENRIDKKSKAVADTYTFLWVFVWAFFAVFRLVKFGIGGSDAIDYVYFFENCNAPYDETDYKMYHTGSDLLYLWINKIIRFFTSDYHVLFAILYSYMCYGYIKFLRCFSRKYFSIVPFFLVFYLYLRGYSSIRSNLAICFILRGIVSLVNAKTKRAYLFLILSLLTHKMSIVYSLVIPFCQFYWNRKINIFKISILLSIVYISCLYLRIFFIEFASIVDLGGAYKSYAEISQDSGRFAWINDFGQMLIGIVFLLFSRVIRKDINKMTDIKEKRSFSILWLVCVFDILMVPVNQLMGIYRGYEFFYLARLLMWGYILYLLTRKQDVMLKAIMSTLVFALFVAWFVFRVSHTFEDTCLMPYIFEPFQTFI